MPHLLILGGLLLPPDQHWSLRPIARPAPPAVEHSEWPREPIDGFVLEKLENAGLKPQREAERATLLRRLSFDLTGLPPTPEEIAVFVADPAPDAYERQLERLLASAHYGERFGRLWLDIARFSESQGFEYDKLRDHAWPYRDWVVASLNADLPYDRFMALQVAGDVLEPVTRDGIVATAFLVCGPWDEAGNGQANATQRAITREEELEDLIGTVGQAFLGLTVHCARCHDHKFDPIPQADYYRLQSVFAGVRHGERPLATGQEIAARAQRIAEIELRIRKCEGEIAALDARGRERAFEAAGLGNDAGEIVAQLSREERQQRDSLLELIAAAHAERAAVPEFDVGYVGRRESPAPTQRLLRGDVKCPAEIAPPGALSAISTPSPDFGLAADAPESERRIAFARWLADPRNPLPARVIVNRLWQWHFGRGLVATPSDLGTNGGAPSHPELLDWLASELVANRWSLKSLHRAIVQSATFRQGSRSDTAALAKDADHRLLWRFAPRRIEAEMVRDAALFVSGALDLGVGGPSFRPFESLPFPTNAYRPLDTDRPEFRRRSLYRMNVHSGKDPLLDLFDCPDPSIRTPVRGSTTTPLQALALMNDPFVLREAERFARRMLEAHHGAVAAAIDSAFLHAFGRRPLEEELREALQLERAHGLAQVTWCLFNATEFVDVR